MCPVVHESDHVYDNADEGMDRIKRANIRRSR
jgi:hypothetical protein